MDRVAGWLDAREALAAWQRDGNAVGTVEQLTVEQLADWSGEPITVVDVRGESEWRAGHIPEAVHIPLGDLAGQLAALPTTPLVLQCQSGGRSAIAASLLKRLGRSDVRNLVGGYVAWSTRTANV
jgi:hydroxyacylglutathione hydrolase